MEIQLSATEMNPEGFELQVDLPEERVAPLAMVAAGSRWAVTSLARPVTLRE